MHACGNTGLLVNSGGVTESQKQRPDIKTGSVKTARNIQQALFRLAEPGHVRDHKYGFALRQIAVGPLLRRVARRAPVLKKPLKGLGFLNTRIV
jgi:hypothetical protein